ncbi:MAG: hypothetical protein C0483_01050 [Pirellula sp.]|nr:hypothetical protein [Pirellula sp.]
MMLMRHKSIETTMKYYVGRNAKTAAQVLWEAHERSRTAGDTSVTVHLKKHATLAITTPQALVKKGFRK